MIYRAEVFDGDPALDRKVVGADVEFGEDGRTQTGPTGDCELDLPEPSYSVTVTAAGFEVGLGRVTATAHVLRLSLTRKVNAISRLHIEGRNFKRENGSTWLWKGFSDFGLLAKFVRGEDIQPILNERKAYGANLLRVFRFAAPPNVFALHPSVYSMDQLIAFVDLAGVNGFYVELTAGDAQKIPAMVDPRDQQNHLNQVTDALQNKPNVFIETCNEPFKNGIDVGWVKPLSPLLRASGDYDLPTVQRNALDFITVHGRRDGEDDYPKWLFDPIVEWYNGWSGFPPVTKPIVHDEPRGFAEENVPGKRSNEPRKAWLLGASSAIWLAGATFHSDDGIRSDPLRPVQAACAEAFFKGLNLSPL